MNERLNVTNLAKTYPEFALGPLTFDLPAGYIMGLIGPNGAGKTTTLRLLLDMAQPSSGEFTLNGARTADARQQARDDLGAMLDSTTLPDAWTMKDVDSNMKRLFPHWDSQQFMKLVAQFDINPKTMYRRLSKGTQNKVNLAVALSHHAKLLILDEPMAGLDPIARDELRQLLQSYIQDGEASVLLSSHLTDDLAQFADYLLYLIHGEQRFFGETDTLLSRYLLVQGGSSELTAALKNRGLGLRQTSVGFSLLLPTADQALATGLVTSTPDLDTLMIYLGKRGEDHA